MNSLVHALREEGPMHRLVAPTSLLYLGNSLQYLPRHDLRTTDCQKVEPQVAQEQLHREVNLKVKTTPNINLFLKNDSL